MLIRTTEQLEQLFHDHSQHTGELVVWAGERHWTLFAGEDGETYAIRVTYENDPEHRLFTLHEIPLPATPLSQLNITRKDLKDLVNQHPGIAYGLDLILPILNITVEDN